MENGKSQAKGLSLSHGGKRKLFECAGEWYEGYGITSGDWWGDDRYAVPAFTNEQMERIAKVEDFVKYDEGRGAWVESDDGEECEVQSVEVEGITLFMLGCETGMAWGEQMVDGGDGWWFDDDEYYAEDVNLGSYVELAVMREGEGIMRVFTNQSANGLWVHDGRDYRQQFGTDQFSFGEDVRKDLRDLFGMAKDEMLRGVVVESARIVG